MAPARKVNAFEKDEKVLCFHHELLYEAKVLNWRPVDASDKNSPQQYRVHYKGWKATYVLSLSYRLSRPFARFHVAQPRRICRGYCHLHLWLKEQSMLQATKAISFVKNSIPSLSHQALQRISISPQFSFPRLSFSHLNSSLQLPPLTFYPTLQLGRLGRRGPRPQVYG